MDVEGVGPLFVGEQASEVGPQGIIFLIKWYVLGQFGAVSVIVVF